MAQAVSNFCQTISCHVQSVSDICTHPVQLKIDGLGHTMDKVKILCLSKEHADVSKDKWERAS